MEVVASLSQGRTAAAQCGLFTHKSVPVIFEPPCNRAELFSLTNHSIKAQNKIWVHIYRGGDVKDQSLFVISGILQEFFFLT